MVATNRCGRSLHRFAAAYAALLLAVGLWGAGGAAQAAAAPPASGASSKPAGLFKDFNFSAWWAPDVTLAAQLGLFHGYPDGTFRPDQPITRAEFAVALQRAVALPAASAGAPTGFADVKASDWFGPSVAALVSAGVIKPDQYQLAEPGHPAAGYVLRPASPITRGEIATWAGRLLARFGATPSQLGTVIRPMRALNLQATLAGSGVGAPSYDQIRFFTAPVPSKPVTPSFSDLPPTSPNYADIMRAARFGIVSGFPDGTFRPGDPATRAEAAKMTVVLVNELTSGAPSAADLQQVLAADLKAVSSLINQLPPQGATVQQVVSLMEQAALAPYFPPGSRRSSAQEILTERRDFSGIQTLTMAPAQCRPIFLGASVAELQCVESVSFVADATGGLAGAKAAIDGWDFFARIDGHWSPAGASALPVLPPWFGTNTTGSAGGGL